MAAGLRAQDLASEVGMDPTALSKIENGRRAVKSTELARLANALKISPMALLEDDPLLAKLPIAARAAGPSIKDGGAYDRLVSLTELHVILADAGIRTSPNLASIPNVRGFEWMDAANALSDWAIVKLPLDANGDQRLASLADQIEAELKVDVFVDAFPADALSGAAITDTGFPLLFVNSAFTRPRSLFTLAHELGHLLAGHSDDGVSLDRELTGSTDAERTANAFAARFLLPESEIVSTLEQDGRRMSTLVDLTDQYGVSYETLVYRLHNLRLIDADGRDRLMALSWQSLLNAAGNTLRESGFSQARIGKLRARSQVRPSGRPPAMLLRRAFDGFQKGIISVRPLAGLLKEDATVLLNELTEYADGPGIAAYLDMPQLVENSADVTDEELFSGTPV
jgi:Zn-dependent peptidase ImmA (M78 family)/DNA-binding Xre family transcriptional regulator